MGILTKKYFLEFFRASVPPLVWKVTRSALDKIAKKAKVQPYTGFSIVLPANHMLSTYKKRHLEYDRFLPSLAKYISHTNCIIDIGANVGDTLASMVQQNSKSEYFCIEADEDFYNLLLENVNRIRDQYKNLRVQTINNFVGQKISNVKLYGENGTKHAVEIPGNKTIKSVKLDDLLKNLSYERIGLLKTDVDGFDYDVLDSSFEIIKANSPILFFELFFSNEIQKQGYNKTITFLADIGYCDWTVFDNFGAVVIRTSEIKSIFQLMNYVERQNLRLSTRTIHYFDILAVQKEHHMTVDLALRDHLSVQSITHIV